MKIPKEHNMKAQDIQSVLFHNNLQDIFPIKIILLEAHPYVMIKYMAILQVFL